MRKLVKILLCITASCFFACASIAQNVSNNYRAVHWGLDEGLSQGETYHMIKDVNGFLWIGTRYGLNRFDGNSFKVYTHQRNNNKSLIANDVVGGLIEDSLHNIWIGSNEGLSRYNIRPDDFTNFFCDTTFNDDPEISPFWATKKEVFCIESESLITAYDIHSSAKRVIGNLGNYKRKIIGISATYSIFDSNTNSVWCLVENDEGKAGLLQIMLLTQQRSFFAFQYHRKKNSQSFAEDMCYDAARKCIWVNSTEGLLQFILADTQFHHINALSKYEHLKNYDRFLGIILDEQKRVWLATNPKGIIVYDPSDESVTFPFPADSATQHDVSDANACIYYDRDNIVWSGFWLRKGICALVPYLPVVKFYGASPKKDSLQSPFAVTTVDAGKGKIWVGTLNSIHILDTKKGSFRKLQQKDFPGLQAHNGIISVTAIDSIRKKVWLDTYGSFFRADMLSRKCVSIVFETLKNEFTLQSGIPEFNGKEIFFFSLYKDSGHVAVLDLDSDTAHEIFSFKSNPLNLVNTVVVEDHFLFLQGKKDEKDNQTYENKNGKWVRIYAPLDSSRWTSITHLKENDSYWVAGENKLIHFDNRFNILKKYTPDNGLPELPIAGLINDDNGNIWFHTDRSIQELNVVTGQIKTMSETEGFEKQNFELLPRVNKDASGNIYYSGGIFGNGFDKISPGNFISTISNVYLRSLSVDQKPFPLNAGINYTDTLSLNYDQTKIEIETGIIDFYSGGKSRLRYKLEGNSINESWHYAPYYNTIRFDGLPPGKYRLVMQASNASNEFNGPAKILFINISPAFWNTWWFRIIAGIFIIAIVYVLIRWWLHQKFKLQFERLEKENRMSELKQQASELEMQILRSQMNPHFIFNCLSSINSFILKNRTEEASKYLTKFSRLIRMVLNNSKESFISLEEELETLRLYLDMEKLRFKNSFEYTFNLTEGIEVENIFVPPLLLQPFAENAIWHGLMHLPDRQAGKQESGFLNFDLAIQEKILICIITDNGIGREKAGTLKSKSAENQRSLGLKITSERLSLLNKADSDRTFFSIEDLTDQNGNATGTRVHLKICYKGITEV